MTQISDFWSVKCIYAYMLINPKLKKQNEAAERRMTSHLLNRLDIEPLIIFKFAWSVAETYLSSFKMLGSFSDFTSLVVQVQFSLINSSAVLQYFIFTFFTVCFLFKHFYFNFLHANFRRVSRWKVFVIFFSQHCFLTKFWVRLSKVWHTHLEDWLVYFSFFVFSWERRGAQSAASVSLGPLSASYWLLTTNWKQKSPKTNPPHHSRFPIPKLRSADEKTARLLCLRSAF